MGEDLDKFFSVPNIFRRADSILSLVGASSSAVEQTVMDTFSSEIEGPDGECAEVFGRPREISYLCAAGGEASLPRAGDGGEPRLFTLGFLDGG